MLLSWYSCNSLWSRLPSFISRPAWTVVINSLCVGAGILTGCHMPQPLYQFNISLQKHEGNKFSFVYETTWPSPPLSPRIPDSLGNEKPELFILRSSRPERKAWPPRPDVPEEDRREGWMDGETAAALMNEEMRVLLGL